MPPTTFARGKVRVTTPPSYDARRAVRRRTRGLPDDREAIKDEMVAGARGERPRRRRAGRPGPARNARPRRRGQIELEVDVPRDQDAVVLLERDGVYSWHLPANPARGQGAEARAADGPVRDRRSPAATGTAGRRGLLGRRPAAPPRRWSSGSSHPPLLEKAVEMMEAHVATGLVHLADADVSTWRRFETLDELDLPTDRPARLLLLVHGTFSSTVGGFGAPGRRGERARASCGPRSRRTTPSSAIDHRTLSVDPLQNAEDLLKRLATHRPEARARHRHHHAQPRRPGDARVRGGGAARRRLAGQGRHRGLRRRDQRRHPPGRPRSAGATWSTSTRTSAAAPPVVGGTWSSWKGIGAFVKYLVSYAAEGDEVPGLQAMMPGGAFVKEHQPDPAGAARPGDELVRRLLELPRLARPTTTTARRSSPRALVAKLAEGFVDRLFKGDNDLVVDVASMSAIDTGVGGFVRDSFALGENDVVYHTNYFDQLSVIEALAGWLPLGLGAGGDEELRRAGRMASSRAGRRPERRRWPPPGREPRAGAAPRAGAGRPRRAGQPRRGDAGDRGGEAGVRRSACGSRAARSRPLPARRTPRATWSSTPSDRSPCSSSGSRTPRSLEPDSDVFELPPGGGVSELEFRAQSLAAGPVAVLVVVRQGRVPIATLRLDATAVGKEEIATMPLGTPGHGQRAPGHRRARARGPALPRHRRAGAARAARSSTSTPYASSRGSRRAVFESGRSRTAYAGSARSSTTWRTSGRTRRRIPGSVRASSRTSAPRCSTSCSPRRCRRTCGSTARRSRT